MDPIIAVILAAIIASLTIQTPQIDGSGTTTTEPGDAPIVAETPGTAPTPLPEVATGQAVACILHSEILPDQLRYLPTILAGEDAISGQYTYRMDVVGGNTLRLRGSGRLDLDPGESVILAQHTVSVAPGDHVDVSLDINGEALRCTES